MIAERLERFSEKGSTLIRQAAAHDSLLVSVISVWEVALLDMKGRVRLNLPCHEWVKRALDVPGLHLVGLSPEIAIDSTRLPGQLHGDPADRILVATAARLGARLMTADRRLIEYGARHRLPIVSA